jgi:hypothetical protein
MEISVNIHIALGHTFNYTHYLLAKFLVPYKIKFYSAFMWSFSKLSIWKEDGSSKNHEQNKIFHYDEYSHHQ